MMTGRTFTSALGLLVALLAASLANAATVAYWRMEVDNDAGAGLSTPNEIAGAPAATAVSASLSGDVFGSPIPRTGDSNTMSAPTTNFPANAAISASPFAALENLTSATIEFWLRDTRNREFSLPLRFSNANNPGLSRGFIFRDTTNLYVAYATPFAGGGVGTQLVSGVDFSDGAWRHVAFTYDQATAVGNLYIDGDLKASDTGLAGTPLRFTSPGTNLDFGLDVIGGIDELRISDVALAPSQFLMSATSLIGDYNDNGTVDAADYTVWRDAFGSGGPLLNDPLGGTIGSAQYNQWVSNFGNAASASASTSSSVPEPSTLVLTLAMASMTLTCRSKNTVG